MSKKYQQYKLEGTCVRCGDVRLSGKVRCAIHHSEHLGYQAKAKVKAISAGNCRYCLHTPSEPNRSMCGGCLLKHGAKQKAAYQKTRTACLVAYGGKCMCCGDQRVKYLQLDHIHNDGAEHRRHIIGRGGNNYTWAFQNGFPDNLQLLCANCHQAKTVYGGCEPSDHA